MRFWGCFCVLTRPIQCQSLSCQRQGELFKTVEIMFMSPPAGGNKSSKLLPKFFGDQKATLIRTIGQANNAFPNHTNTIAIHLYLCIQTAVSGAATVTQVLLLIAGSTVNSRPVVVNFAFTIPLRVYSMPENNSM